MQIVPCEYCDAIDIETGEIFGDRSGKKIMRVWCVDCGHTLGELDVIESLLMISKVRGYQRGWVYHQFLLMNDSPSITELRQLAYCLGYKAPWAEHCYQEIYGDALPIPQEEFVPPDLKLPDLSRFNIAGIGIPQPVT
jgi:hypothetical protein